MTEATFGDRVADLEPTPLAEALLADAQFFKWGHLPQAAAPTILLAAIACEVHVKNVIRRTAGDKIELAEVLLSQPRDFSIAAYALFSDVIGAVTGRSLKAENPALDKAVRRLFETRNRLAHRGEVQDAKAALESLTTADAVFAWLRTFSTVSTNGTEKESS